MTDIQILNSDIEKLNNLTNLCVELRELRKNEARILELEKIIGELKTSFFQ